jgi:hypothetical protein
MGGMIVNGSRKPHHAATFLVDARQQGPALGAVLEVGGEVGELLR